MKQFEQFEQLKGKDGQYYFNLFDGHCNFLFQSEGYKSKRGKNVGLNAVRKCSQFPENYVKKTAQDGRFYFVLRARNNEVLGTSKMCDTAEERDECITSTMKRAKL